MSSQQTLERHKAKPLPCSEPETGEKRDKKTTRGGTNEGKAAEDICNWICADPKGPIWNERSQPPNEKKLSYGYWKRG
jgi:hypothetical protein